MTIRNLERRLDRLDSTDGGLGFAEALDAACRRAHEKERAWRAAGNTGSPPPEPLKPLSPGATRAQRELWRKIAEGRVRVLHMSGRQPSPFRDIADAYAMSDDDLLHTINQAESAGRQP